MKWSRFIVLAALFASIGCSDPPAATRTAEINSPNVVLAPQIQTIRDSWLEIARDYPNYAGVWLDSAGALVISSSTGEASDALRRRVATWLQQYGRNELAERVARVQRVSFGYEELDNVRMKLEKSFVGMKGVNSFWVDEVAGRAKVGVDDAATGDLVRSALTTLPLQASSHGVEVSGPRTDVACTALRSVCSPMMAGLGVVSVAANSVCSLGLIGWRVDSLQPSQPDLNYKVATTASHCTNGQGSVAGDVFFQPAPPPAGRAIGYEVDDAPIYPNSYCSAYGYPAYTRCRWADVAVVRMYDSVAIAAGMAATSNNVTPPTNPPWISQQLYTGQGVVGVLVGDSVFRIGSWSGQKKGIVQYSCVTTLSTSTGYTDVANLCQHQAIINVNSGDSGGLAYVNSGINLYPRPAGVVIQGTSNVIISPFAQVHGTLGYKYYLSW